MRCANCDTELGGPYCAACGQRADVRPLTIGPLLARVFGEITSFELPLLRTLRGLLSRPGRVADEYARGHRVRYTNPVKWALLSTALAFFVGQLFGTRGAVRFEITADPDATGMTATLVRCLESNMAPLFVLVMLPVLALALRLCFAGTGRTTAEELALVLYTYGCAAVLQVVYAPLVALGAPAGLGGPLPLVWTAWGAIGFHPRRKPWVSVILVVLAHALWIALLLGVALLVFKLREL